MFSEKFQNRFLVISFILGIFGALMTTFDDDPIPGVPTVETEDAATYSSEEDEYASGHSYHLVFPNKKLDRKKLDRFLPDTIITPSFLIERDRARSEQMEQPMEFRRSLDKAYRELEQRALSTISEVSVGTTTQSPSVSQDNPDVEVKEPTEPAIQKEDDNN